MKKFVLIGLTIFASTFLTACPWDTEPLCEAQKNAADKFANSIGSAFGCAKTDVIAKDLNAALEPLKLCEAQSTGGILADIVCPPMVKYAVSQGLNLLPKEWECSGGTTTDALEDKLIVLCKSVPY